MPCITLRDSTERPITCELGTNVVVGSDRDGILEATHNALSREWEPAQIPLWDGRTADRIAEILVQGLED